MNKSGADSVSTAFEAAAAKYAEQEFLHVPVESCRGYSAHALTLPYAEARTRVEAIAARLRTAGYGSGHRIAVALDNRIEFFLYFLALNSLGISIVPLNAAMSTHELSFILAHCDAALVLTHEGHAGHVGGCVSRVAALHVVTEEARAFPAAARPPVAAPNEAALLYTSGTTGAPKGCILSNEYFLEIGRLYTGLGGYCRFLAGDRLATPLPVTHMNALAVSFMAMLMTGGCLIQLDRFHPTTWWQSLRTSRATVFHYLGVMPALLLKAPPVPQDPVEGALRFGFGAGVDARHHAAFEARFAVPLIEAWAMTETGAGAWITANREPRHVGQRCFGKAPKGLTYRIVDESGIDAAPGVVGELLVRQDGENPRRGFFSGYYRDERATEQAWAGGWFHTGDLVRVGEDGCFFFVDRSKNVIRRSGENIAAVEVESALQAHPDVLAAAVCPVPDELRGEEVFAFVVLRESGSPTLENALRIQSHCLQSLAYYKSPAYVAFRPELPQTASQKLARAQIKGLAARALEAGEAFDLRNLKRRAAAVRE
ncbi:MAG TPA: AMP-binding protein [Steroidobacteraceae bacterium]|nr:AMP-binding protein [Steroidobacteraceae bacterium]